MTNSFAGQVTDRNFLQATGFRFTVARANKVGFFGNAINVPGFNLNSPTQASYLKMIPRVGGTLDYNDLRIRFLIDQNLENYLQIQTWMRGIGFPESLNEIYRFQNSWNLPKENKSEINLTSDGTLTILSGSSTPLFSVKFTDMFPVSLSDINFDSTLTDVEYLTAEVSFKYLNYTIEPFDCC
jgi:hypothetical protein